MLSAEELRDKLADEDGLHDVSVINDKTVMIVEKVDRADNPLAFTGETGWRAGAVIPTGGGRVLLFVPQGAKSDD